MMLLTTFIKLKSLEEPRKTLKKKVSTALSQNTNKGQTIDLQDCYRASVRDKRNFSWNKIS